jgi:hypothetical protein
MKAELYQLTPDGKLRFHLHRGQAQAWRSTRRFVFVIAGTQGGKTSFVPLWLDREIQQQGHGDYLAATASYDLFKLKFLPEMRRYFVDMMGWQEDKSDRVFWRLYKPKMFDRIILRSASSEGGLESATAKAAALDECGQDDFRITAWEAVQRRLSLSQGRVLGATTPYNLGWLKREVYDRWRNGDQDYHVIQFRSIDNPAFPLAEYERAKATYDDWKFRMFYDGEFTRPAGLIYNCFNADTHVVKPFEIPAHWPRYVGIDFGAVNTALAWVTENPEKQVYYLYRESLGGGMSTNQHAAAALSLAKNENVIRWTGGARSETQQRMDWNAAGVPVGPSPIIDVEAGIDRVIELFKSNRLFIFDDCRGIIDELGTYSRELDDTGQPTDKIKDKETFHRLDALRYDASALTGSGLIIFGA